MAGYHGYSMSNNAVCAYDCGEKPLSKWTKADMVDEAKKQIAEYPDELRDWTIDDLKYLRVGELRSLVLHRSSWHHTSSYYNATNFYSVDILSVKKSDIESIISVRSAGSEPVPTQEEHWLCEFLVWSGTRNHPKATPVRETGIIRGNWFYPESGGKKSIHANGFRKIQKFEEA